MISFFKIQSTESDIEAVAKIIKRGSYWAMGPEIEQFETKISNYIGTKHALTFNSGTSALHAMLLAYGVGVGDEVIVPSFTFIATANAVRAVGATPVFADIDTTSYGLNFDSVYGKITPKTKAIMPIHYAGGICWDTEILQEVCKEKKILFFEDAAQSFGASLKGKKAGTFGDSAIFSFCQDKIIPCLLPKTNVVVKRERNGKRYRYSKKIKAVKIGDEVLTYNETNGEKEYKRVVQTFKRPFSGSVVCLTFSNKNELKITDNHPIYVVGKGWTQAGNIVVGDKVIQYHYQELGYRVNSFWRRGKNWKEQYGRKKAKIYGKRVSDGIKKSYKINSSMYDKYKDPLFGKKISDGRKANPVILSDSQRRHMSLSQKRRFVKIRENQVEYEGYCKKCKEVWTKERREQARKRVVELLKNPSYRKKLSDGVRRAMERDSYWKHYSVGLNLKPNKKEKTINGIIESICPGEFSYNGDYRLGISIDRLIPDFVNINGKKKVIDFLGTHWHKKEEEKERKIRYKKMGYDSLMIWENELEDKEVLKGKIETFVFNPNIEIVVVIRREIENYIGDVFNLGVQDNNNYFAYGILVHNCGEGGTIVTDDKAIYEKLKLLRSHGRQETGENYFSSTDTFDYVSLGYNWRMPTILAALGLSQMEKIDKIIEQRQERAQWYHESIMKTQLNKLMTCPYTDSSGRYRHVCQKYTIRSDRRDDLQKYLSIKGIQTRAYFGLPVHLTSYYRSFGHKQGELPITESMAKQVLSLPIYPDLTKVEIKDIVETIRRFYTCS